jgi:RNA polymerase primary sigma factor
MGTKRRKPAVEPEHIAKYIKLLNGSEHDAAVEGLCRAFEPLAVSLASTYYQDDIGTEREDLEQVARLGLVEACITFDPKKGAAFSAHATWRIRSALSSYVQRLENPTRLPTWLMHTLPKLRKMMVKVANELGREPTAMELANRLKLKVEVVEAMLAYISGPTPLNIELRNGSPESLAWHEQMVNAVDGGGMTPEEIIMKREKR